MISVAKLETRVRFSIDPRDAAILLSLRDAPNSRLPSGPRCERCGNVSVLADVHIRQYGLAIPRQRVPLCCHCLDIATAMPMPDVRSKLRSLLQKSAACIPTGNFRRTEGGSADGDLLPVKADFFFETSRSLIVEDCDSTVDLRSDQVASDSTVEDQVGKKLAAALNSEDDAECIATLSANYGVGVHPQIVKVEPTQYCNMRCTFCSNPELSDRKHLRLARFARIWEQLDPSQILKVGFTGLGESMLNKELWAMHSLVKQHGIYTTMVTNGALLFRNASRIVDSGINAIAVSVESMDEKIYARDRVGGKLDDVLLGLRHLAESGAMRPTVNVICAVKPGSERDAIAVIEYCRELGLPQPKVYPTYERFSRQGVSLNVNADATMDAVRVALSAAYGSVGPLCREDRLVVAASTGMQYAELACTEPKRVFVIRADGSFTSCNEAIFDLLDLDEHRQIGGSAMDAWRSDHYRRRRLSLYFREPMASCAGCNAFTIPNRLTHD